MLVELRGILGRDPGLENGLAASLLDFVAVEELLLDLEPRDVANAARLNVLVAGDSSESRPAAYFLRTLCGLSSRSNALTRANSPDQR
ncbi:MAG TPA: hypothetical protein VFD59_11195 [Nocardioidaceae bacterium]|nr:hypothetical protein [Nocardioidaceae bacterium]